MIVFVAIVLFQQTSRQDVFGICDEYTKWIEIALNKLKDYSTAKSKILEQSESPNEKIQRKLNNAIEMKGLITMCENDIHLIASQYTNNDNFGVIVKVSGTTKK